MNEMYALNDMNLAKEKDDNMALLRLLKDHVHKEEQIWYSKPGGYY